MKILIYLHHPAHFHLFKNIIAELSIRNKLIILATKKDILEELLNDSGIQYINVLPNGRKDSKISIALGLMKQDFRLAKIALMEKPDLLIGTSTEITHIGSLLSIPSLFLNEDDIDVIPLVGKIAYPFAKHILVPFVCNTSKWNYKSIKYSSYHELAYLHPNHFKAKPEIVKKYFSPSEDYTILRFAKLGAHHDVGINGINDDLAVQIIEKISNLMKVYITSERPLIDALEQYRLPINPLDIHHVMAFASLYIGDSQTMAAESGVLGVPFIRFNDFVGRIGYLNELESKYQLGFGIKSKDSDKLLEKIDELLSMPNRKAVFQKRRESMLNEKIDYSKFLVWFIENYPESSIIMKENPEYQYKFR